MQLTQKILGWSRKGCHTSFRSSQDFSRSKKSREPEVICLTEEQAKLSGQLLQMLPAPESYTLQLVLYMVS